MLLLCCPADDLTTCWTVEVAVAVLPRASNASDSLGKSLRKVKIVDNVSIAGRKGLDRGIDIVRFDSEINVSGRFGREKYYLWCKVWGKKSACYVGMRGLAPRLWHGRINLWDRSKEGLR